MNDALTLRLDDEIFAIDARSVREILEMVPVTRVPGAPACMDAVINVRGRIVPLADLRVLFGMPRGPADVHTRIVVMELTLDEEAVVVGMIADAVHDVTDIAPATIQDAPRVGMRWPAEFVRGVGRRNDSFVILPNMERIFETIGGESAPLLPQERANS